jgi:hypothetical protein
VFRLTLSVAGVVAMLAATHPASADPAAATASDRARAESSAPEQVAAPTAVRASTSDATQPASLVHERDVPVGFGWG